MCRNYGLQFASFDTSVEAAQFIAMATANPTLFTAQTHVGGTHMTPGDIKSFVWVATNQPISYPIGWATGEPNDAKMFCLTLQKGKTNIFSFGDVLCDDATVTMKFICQK